MVPPTPTLTPERRRRPRALRPTLSIVVPFYRNLTYLRRCLAAFSPLPAGAEVIVVADAAVDDCRPLIEEFGARLLEIPGPSGPAIARNRGAAVAHGQVLVFVDSDVVIAPNALARIVARFRAEPEVQAVFGTYDDTPGAANFVSQYKNLAHAFVHRSSSTIATTFWSGLGAIRTRAFWSVGGFDERFPRPCIEDIDLGYRLHERGYAIRLDHDLRGCHLKRWTVRSMIASDVLDRGIPWTQLIVRAGRVHNDLNIKSAYRVSVALAYALLAVLALSLATLHWLWAAAPIVAMLYFLNQRFYTFFIRTKGLAFAVRVLPLHYLYHLYNGVSFAVGTVVYFAARAHGGRIPGALPFTPWTGPGTETWDMVTWEPQRVAAPAD
jgi:glycosyltransferase involved in cell wall biosynthesis